MQAKTRTAFIVSYSVAGLCFMMAAGGLSARVRVAMGLPQVNNARGATDVTTDSARLNGALTAAGDAPSAVWVFWGEADGGTSRQGWEHGTNLGARAVRQSLSVVIPVQPNRVHYYRYHVTNSLGESAWATTSSPFRTPGSPRVSVDRGALPVGRLSATLNAVLSTGFAADITVSLGKYRGDEVRSMSVGTVGKGPFRVMVANLSPGTEYVYRVSASNRYGVATTETVRFATIQDHAGFGGGDGSGYAASRFVGRLSWF